MPNLDESTPEQTAQDAQETAQAQEVAQASSRARVAAGEPKEPLLDLLEELYDALGEQHNVKASVLKEDPNIPGRFATVWTGTRVLSADEIGKLFGGGTYKEIVQWGGGQHGVPRRKTEVPVYLHPIYDDLARKRRAELRKAEQEPEQLGTEKVIELATRLAAMQQPGAGAGVAALAPVLERIMDRIDRMQERTDARFEKILDAMHAPRGTGISELKELLVLGQQIGVPGLPAPAPVVEAREPWLDVVEMVSDNVGKFLEMLAESQKSAAARLRLMADPMARKVATDGRKAMQNPETRAKMIAHLDAKIGPEQTNQILKALGVER